MTGKDDALNQSRPAPRTLWLNAENMAEARDNWFRAYREIEPAASNADEHTWQIAWAAAVAAHSYIFEGRTGPKA